MPPVKKQKTNIKLSKNSKKTDKKIHNADESVVSGQLQKKIRRKKQKPQKDPKGVVFIKHLPHGFFEDQLKKYFEQFGKITRVRLARSKRTGNSKGFAFVEFEYPEVAEVAAQTMDNYLMFKQIIKASYIPPEKQQFNYFRSSLKKIRNKSGKTVWVSSKTASMQQKTKKHNDWSEENYQKRTKKQLEKLKKMDAKYSHLGIDLNKIIVQPTVVTTKDEKLPHKAKVNTAVEENPVTSSKIKRKSSKADVALNKEHISKKSKLKIQKQVSLEDSLDDYLQEDTEDEDYIAVSGQYSSEDNESSDEESYGFAKDSDEETNPEHHNSENDCDEEPKVVQKKMKRHIAKSSKGSNVERFDKMITRKPLSGGIKKLNTRILKKAPIVAKKKQALQITAAKEMAKPLSKVKGKSNKPLKVKKNLIKVK